MFTTSTYFDGVFDKHHPIESGFSVEDANLTEPIENLINGTNNLM